MSSELSRLTVLSIESLIVFLIISSDLSEPLILLLSSLSELLRKYLNSEKPLKPSFLQKRSIVGIPVIFLTAKATLDDRLRGLTSGAEDYMVKPFEIVELLARVNIVLRRYNKMEQQLTFKDIAIDTKNQNVSKAGKHIELTPKEFELLELLMRNKNITLFREKIYEEIWGSEYSVESRTLDLHIQRLRKKLDIGDSLKTVFKAGYRLEE